MSRKNKNIIIIILMLLLCCGIIFTMFNTKNDVDLRNNTNMNENSMGGTPPDMPNGNNSNVDEPPEKPNEENSDSSNIPPDMSGENNLDNVAPFNMNNNSNTSSLSLKNYIIFGSECLLLTLLVIYLLMSKFNKKSFKETFSSSDKISIFILSTLLLSFFSTYATSYITKTYLLKSIENTEMPGNSSTNVSYSSKNEINKDTSITSGTYDSNNSDENSILVNGDITVGISNVTVTKTGDSAGGDNTSFYGTNSAIIAKDGAQLSLKNITVTTNATGANGVFSYGGSATTTNSSSDNTTINISDSKITTTKDNSGGIMTTGGGITNASNLTINTAGTSSAAIRTDRGGGTVNVDGGTYKTTGQGSPTIYSTANVTVKNSKLEATSSEGIVIEGKNSVTIDNVTLTDTNNKLNGLSTTYKNIFMYQSMSGDADTGNSELTSSNSTITTNKGDTFYITNTTATIKLTNNTIVNNDSSGNFLRAQKDSWGTNGSNGGNVILTTTNQKITGNIVIDSISTLDMSLNNNSYYEGTINTDDNAKSIKLSLDSSSKIKLTGDSYVTSLDDEESDYKNIDFNGYKLYVNGKSIN